MTEEQDLARRKIYWQCRRGMLELDALLMGFLDNGYDTLSDEQQQSFNDLLKCQDALLLEYLMGRTVPRDPALAAIVSKIRKHPHNKD